MNIIKNGNFTPWVRASIWIFGLIIAVLSYFFLDENLMFWGMLGGIVIAAIGAYSEKVNTLKLKPFDNIYKKTRESYDKERDDL